MVRPQDVGIRPVDSLSSEVYGRSICIHDPLFGQDDFLTAGTAVSATRHAAIGEDQRVLHRQDAGKLARWIWAPSHHGRGLSRAWPTRFSALSAVSVSQEISTDAALQSAAAMIDVLRFETVNGRVDYIVLAFDRAADLRAAEEFDSDRLRLRRRRLSTLQHAQSARDVVVATYDVRHFTPRQL
jgi:hypothetical protein